MDNGIPDEEVMGNITTEEFYSQLASDHDTVSKQGSKHDDDPYEKPDLSLVPWDILSKGWTECDIYHVMKVVHSYLNREVKFTADNISHLLHNMVRAYGPEPLAITLGYGTEKYNRDDWKKGFGGDIDRFLRALLRHGKAFKLGAKYDNEAIGKYTKGTSHIGAMQFCLMVAEKEIITVVNV